MRRMIFAVGMALLFLPAWAQAVFSVEDYSMVIQVGADGAADFVEEFAYEFSGEYNGMLIAVHLDADVPLSNLRVFVDDDVELTQVDALEGTVNTFAAEGKGAELSIRAYTPGNGGNRVFRVTYRKEEFAKRYQDGGYIGRTIHSAVKEFEEGDCALSLPGVKNALGLPGAKGGLLDGAVSISDGIAVFSPTPGKEGMMLSPVYDGAGQMLSLALSLPAELLSDAPVIPSSLEETKEIQQAMEIKAWQDAKEGERILRYTFIGALFAYFIGFLIVLRKQGKTYGYQRKLKPSMHWPMYSDTPAAIAELLCAKGVSSNALCATLMELADQGFLTMRSEAGDISFAKVESPPKSPRWRHQSLLLEDWLFDDRPFLWIRDLSVGEDEAKASAFVARYAQWKAVVMEDAVNAGWLYNNGMKRGLLSLASFVLGVFLALMMFSAGDPVLSRFAACALVAALGLSGHFLALNRLSADGSNRVAAFQGFLRSYENLLSKEPGAVLSRVPLLFALGAMKTVARWIDQHGNPPEGAFAGKTPVWIFQGWQQSALNMERSALEAQSYNAGIAHGGVGKGNNGFAGGGSGHEGTVNRQ